MIRSASSATVFDDFAPQAPRIPGATVGISGSPPHLVPPCGRGVVPLLTAGLAAQVHTGPAGLPRHPSYERATTSRRTNGPGCRHPASPPGSRPYVGFGTARPAARPGSADSCAADAQPQDAVPRKARSGHGRCRMRAVWAVEPGSADDLVSVFAAGWVRVGRPASRVPRCLVVRCAAAHLRRVDLLGRGQRSERRVRYIRHAVNGAFAALNLEPPMILLPVRVVEGFRQVEPASRAPGAGRCAPGAHPQGASVLRTVRSQRRPCGERSAHHVERAQRSAHDIAHVANGPLATSRKHLSRHRGSGAARPARVTGLHSRTLPSAVIIGGSRLNAVKAPFTAPYMLRKRRSRRWG
jgi:hypothetical protein